MEALIDQSIALVTDAAEREGKIALAKKAEIPESSLRGLGRPGWNPTAKILRKLEIALMPAKPATAAACRNRESATRNRRVSAGAR